MFEKVKDITCIINICFKICSKKLKKLHVLQIFVLRYVRKS